MSMHVARIAFNSLDWQRPSGDAAKLESVGSYAEIYGFGYEEWLFRSEWQIDGWRYGFLQGVNRAARTRIRDGQPFDVSLFTVDPLGRRRWVADIRDVSRLSQSTAVAVWEEFQRLGWAELMRQEVAVVDGKPSAFDAKDYTAAPVNIRFQAKDVVRYPPDTYADAGDPVTRMKRYHISDRIVTAPVRGRAGSADLPAVIAWSRRGGPDVRRVPEHLAMQAKLMAELGREYGAGRVRREQDYVDVSVDTDAGAIYFEIKSHDRPTAVIREAIGQLLEYAYHPAGHRRPACRLVLVGRRSMSAHDARHLDPLRSRFGLPLEYRVVSID